MTSKASTPLNIERFRNILKKHGLKATNQRLAVHNAMLRLGHASADMVLEEIKASCPDKVTIASVYNILTQLADLGIYHHRMSLNNKMYFDINTFNHLHLYDVVNNTYQDIDDNGLLELVAAKLAKRRFKGFKIEDIDVQILCRPTKTRSKIL